MYSCIRNRILGPEHVKNDPCRNLRIGPGPPKHIIHMIFPFTRSTHISVQGDIRSRWLPVFLRTLSTSYVIELAFSYILYRPRPSL